MCVKPVTFGASRTESSSPEETVKSQESVSTDICSKRTISDVNKQNAQHSSQHLSSPLVGCERLRLRSACRVLQTPHK